MKTGTHILSHVSHYASIGCVIFASVIGAAYSQEPSTNSWRPNTKLLDMGARQNDPFVGDAGSTLARDVKHFYQTLRDKKWKETYELRARAFRTDMPESDYLAEAKKYEKLWGLVNYEVLRVEYRSSPSSTNTDEAILICKFTELPGNEVSYSTVFWHREDGIWKCLSAGPNKLSIFDGLRLPFIDWR